MQFSSEVQLPPACRWPAQSKEVDRKNVDKLSTETQKICSGIWLIQQALSELPTCDKSSCRNKKLKWPLQVKL